MKINGVRVIVENGHLPQEEIQYYVTRIEKHLKRLVLKTVTFTLADHYMNLRYSFTNSPFERIRRISFTTETSRTANVS